MLTIQSKTQKTTSFLVSHSFSVIIFIAAVYTIIIKFYWSIHEARPAAFFSWILIDLVFFCTVELMFVTISQIFPQKSITRIIISIAAIICTWSILNAGWLVATGTQILPGNLLSLFGDPKNRLSVIGHHLKIQPVVGSLLLIPGCIALFFLFVSLKRAENPHRSKKSFLWRIAIYYALIIHVVAFSGLIRVKSTSYSESLLFKGLRSNCHINAVKSLLTWNTHRAEIFTEAVCKIPFYDETTISLSQEAGENLKKNVVIVIFEGVAYKQTSLYDDANDLTPYLAEFAQQGALFANTRTPFTHSTKAFFSILTGMFPSISQDYVEAVPAEKPYASIATILENEFDYRTAFFQSAQGDFEGRPGLVYNLGFDKYWSREDNNDPNTYLGYLASDEFAMLDPIENWIGEDKDKPFLLIVLCSATHDPYILPEWYSKEQPKEEFDRYKSLLTYTDSFVMALDKKLAEHNLTNNTIFNIVGDHGEGFGEHARYGHDRIPYDEGLRIVWLLRAPGQIEPGYRSTTPACSVDVTPTLLSLLGFDLNTVTFDGIDMINPPENSRKVFFSSWIQGGQAGYVLGDHKYIYDPINKVVIEYNLRNDPGELFAQEIEGPQADAIIDQLLNWQKTNIIPLTGFGQKNEKLVYNRWLCFWRNREPQAEIVNNES